MSARNLVYFPLGHTTYLNPKMKMRRGIIGQEFAVGSNNIGHVIWRVDMIRQSKITYSFFLRLQNQIGNQHASCVARIS